MLHEIQEFDWQQAHRELSRIAKTRARLDWEEATWLLRALRSGVHVHLGYASFAEYVERIFGYKPRSTEERLRVAEAIEQLPQLEQALREGGITWSVARELTRVATPENEGQWLEAASGRTARQVEEMVTGHRPGDRPSDPTDFALRRHVVRIELSADTLATFREAMAKVRHDAGEPLDDDSAVLLMARHALGGTDEEARSSYQVALTVCEACGRGWQGGQAQPVEVGPEIVEMANCDAQHLGRVDSSAHVGARAARAHQSVPPAVRAHQAVPPAVRRKVKRRDGGRCVVPGCRHRAFLDVHHIVLRSEGGTHDPDSLITLCAAHHRAQHRGQLIIEGRVSTGLTFQHADGTSYGAVVNPQMAEAHVQAFRALRNLGFRENETRAALERVRRASHLEDVSFEGVFRGALRVLCPADSSRVPIDARVRTSSTSS